MFDKIVCRIIKNKMFNKDPFCFQDYKVCSCKLPYCVSKFTKNENYFPKNYQEFKKCMNNINGKPRGSS
jgi:hypothetical protein